MDSAGCGGPAWAEQRGTGPHGAWGTWAASGPGSQAAARPQARSAGASGASGALRPRSWRGLRPHLSCWSRLSAASAEVASLRARLPSGTGCLALPASWSQCFPMLDTDITSDPPRTSSDENEPCLALSLSPTLPPTTALAAHSTSCCPLVAGGASPQRPPAHRPMGQGPACPPAAFHPQTCTRLRRTRWMDFVPKTGHLEL